MVGEFCLINRQDPTNRTLEGCQCRHSETGESRQSPTDGSMPVPLTNSQKAAYLHNNVSPSLFHYQHIRTAQGLQSKSIFDVKEKKDSPRTFKEVWSRVSRAFPSVGEFVLILLILSLCTYGLTLFLRTKYYSGVQHSEL